MIVSTVIAQLSRFRPRHLRAAAPLTLASAFALAIGIFAASYLSSVQKTNISRSVGWVEHTHDVIKALDDILKDAVNAETDQRGFLLTGEASYLEPYQHASQSMQSDLAKAEELTKDNTRQQDRLQVLRGLLHSRALVLEQTIRLSNNGDRRQALDLVMSGEGKHLMDLARQTVTEAEAQEQALLQERTENWEHTQSRWEHLTLGLLIAAVAGAALTGIAFVRMFAARATAKYSAAVADERQRLLDRMSLATIMVRDFDGPIIFWTHGCETLYGWTAEEAVGQSSHKLLRTIYPEPLVEIETTLRRDGVWHGELRNRTKDDVEVRVAAHKVLRRDSDGLSIVENVTDITLLRQAEETLRQQTADLARANADLSAEIGERSRVEEEVRRLNASLETRITERTAELQAANEEIESFSYSVTHDLRAPLRAIQGFSRALLEDYGEQLDSEGRRLANVVCDSTRRMARMIDDVLAFSQLSRTAIRFASVDLEAEVREAIANLAPFIDGREVDFEIGNLPSAQGDVAMLQHVWSNLLGNAVKYTAPRDRAVIQIGAEVSDDETVYSVRDNGVGFDMRYADKLFGTFQRLHGSEFPGTGVGLSIVRRIVTRHQGRVWAEAEVDKGATFFFSLGSAKSERPTTIMAEGDSAGSPP
jgi:PAS domain S-box-containing protein